MLRNRSFIRLIPLRSTVRTTQVGRTLAKNLPHLIVFSLVTDVDTWSPLKLNSVYSLGPTSMQRALPSPDQSLTQLHLWAGRTPSHSYELFEEALELSILCSCCPLSTSSLPCSLLYKLSLVFIFTDSDQRASWYSLERTYLWCFGSCVFVVVVLVFSINLYINPI